MAVEIELKLSLAPEHLDKLKRHPLLKNLTTGRATTQKLYSVYYDTPALDLRSNAMALRLRRAGKQWLQTLKGGGGVQSGLHERNEWEMPVAGEALELGALKASGGKLPTGAVPDLQPVFITDFSRNIRLLKFEGAEIELGLDSGQIRAGEKTRPISELELELKSGEPQQLFKLALALLDAVPLAIENVSKAEYGYRLYSGETPVVRKGGFPKVDKNQSIASALQGMIAAALTQVQANVPGAVQNLDEEYLHQVRVGLRRLRVALAMAEIFHVDDELHALREAMKELNVEFGRLREWDVFVTQTLQQISTQFPNHPGLAKVLRASEKQRSQHHFAVVQRLQAPEYQRLLLRFGAWMYGGYWHDPAREVGLSPMGFAASLLQKRSVGVGRRGKKLGSADAAQLHKLRIACKKLRYTCEMFASLYGQGKAKRYIATLSHLQDILGTLNDLTIAHRLLDEIKGNVQQELLDLIRGWLTQQHAEQKAGLRKAWKKFEGQEGFWIK